MKCKHKSYCNVAKIKKDCSNPKYCQTYKFYEKYSPKDDETFLGIGLLSTETQIFIDRELERKLLEDSLD